MNYSRIILTPALIIAPRTHLLRHTPEHCRVWSPHALIKHRKEEEEEEEEEKEKEKEEEVKRRRRRRRGEGGGERGGGRKRDEDQKQSVDSSRKPF